ncbi:MAG: hypothetical protein H0T46_26565 [Deltaproteobacteria bacterium]|nr:hypothetical protein [Deltaproteobacteria bacterium]
MIDAPKAIDAAAADAAPDGPTSFNCATAPTGGTHKIFLAFEGVTLTRAAVSDATQNLAAQVDSSTTTATIPAWKAAAGNRAVQIQALVCAMRESLLAYDVELVTARPASGNYEMVVFGGGPRDLGLSVPSSSGIAMLAVNDCTNNNPRDVVWVAERPVPSMPTLEVMPIESANSATAGIGIGDGLASSKSAANCMCYTGNDEPVLCTSTQACQLTTSSPIPMGGNYCNAAGTTENQVAKLTARYGMRP